MRKKKNILLVAALAWASIFFLFLSGCLGPSMNVRVTVTPTLIDKAYPDKMPGLEDLFLIKFGFGGGTPFAISLAGTGAGEEGRAIAISESDNTAYAVGFTGGNLDAEPNSGGYDMCLLKFDLAGQQQ